MTDQAQVDFAEAADLPVIDDADRLAGQALVDQLRTVREVRRSIGDLHDSIEDALVAWMARRGLWDDRDLGIVRRSGKKRTRWHVDNLLDDLWLWAREHPHLPETGERLEPDEALMMTVRECLAVSYARVGALRARDLDPDDYCERSVGRQTVDLL